MVGLTSTVPTRFLIISDTHHTEPDEFHEAFSPLPKVDVLLHCGDFTQCGGISSYKKALRILAGIDAELKLVIPGNHDLELDGEYWRNHLIEGEDLPEEHEEAVAFWRGSQAKAAGVTYLEEVYTASNSAMAPTSPSTPRPTNPNSTTWPSITSTTLIDLTMQLHPIRFPIHESIS